MLQTNQQYTYINIYIARYVFFCFFSLHFSHDRYNNTHCNKTSKKYNQFSKDYSRVLLQIERGEQKSKKKTVCVIIWKNSGQRSVNCVCFFFVIEKHAI